MTMKKGISILVGILLIAWGIYAIIIARSGIEEFNLYTGKLNYESGVDEGAYDETFDVYVDSPILVRKVEMLQNVYRDGKGLIIDYSEDHEIISDDEDDYYENPPFPTFPKGEVLCGKLSIADEDVYLSKEYMEKLTYTDYVDFENDGVLYPVSGFEGGDIIAGLIPADDFSYVSGDPNDKEIGDIRVTWYTIDPTDFSEEYTVAGILNENVIEKTSRGIFFYDRKVSEEEIRESFEKGNIAVGIGLIIVGLICVLIPLFMIYKGKKRKA